MSLRSALRASLAVLVASLPLAPVASFGVEPAKQPMRLTKPQPAKAEAPSIEMFDGIKNGQVTVRMIPKDSTEARVLVHNTTNQPLNVRLPDAFAGVHVLAQLGGGGVGVGGGGGAQGLGAGGGGAGGAGGGGAGFFSIPAEMVAEVKVPCVCLDHGKPDPRPQMIYEVRPIETVTAKPEVHEVIKQLGQGKVSQRVAQVAAWHYNNNMSWEELAAKQIERLSGQVYSYFSAQEMQTAFAFATAIEKQLEEGKKVEGQSLSKAAAAPPKP